MSDKRFSWSSASYWDCVIELKRRDIQRSLYKDWDLVCYAKDCRKKLRKGDRCYQPAEKPGLSVNVMAHVECIDRVYAGYVAKDVQTSRLKDAERKGILPLAEKSKASMAAKLSADAAAPLKAVLEQAYKKGWDDCVATLNKLAGGSEDDYHPSH